MEKDRSVNEFIEMKAQLSLLKEKLDRQYIVNERHLRNAISGKLNELNRHAIRMIAVGTVALGYCTYFLSLYNFSKGLITFTAIMLLACIAATYIQHRSLLKVKEMSADMVKETLDLIRLRKRYDRWMLFAIPLIITWSVFISYEILYVVPMNREMGYGMLAGVAVGTIIGGAVGARIHSRTLKKIRTILAQIDELKEMS